MAYETVHVSCPKCRRDIAVEVPVEPSRNMVVECPYCTEAFILDIDVSDSEFKRSGSGHSGSTPKPRLLLPERTQTSIDSEKKRSFFSKRTGPKKEKVRKPRIVRRSLLSPRAHDRLLVVASVMLFSVALLGTASGVMTGLYGITIPTPEDLLQAESATVSGCIIDKATGHGLDGVQISFSNTDLIAVTNGQGCFDIASIPRGEVTMTAFKQGYVSYEILITVNSGTPNFVDIAMRQGDPVQKDLEDRTAKTPRTQMGGTPFVAFAMIACSAAAALSGLFTLFKDRYPIAVIGAFLAIFSGGFIIGALIAFISLVIIISSRDRFRPWVLGRILGFDRGPA